MPSKDLTLYRIEEGLAAFFDTEDLVPAEQMAEFAAELAAKNEQAVAKRDNVIRAIRVMETQVALCKAEEERIREHRKSIEAGMERFRTYVAGVVHQFGEQKPGQKTKTLQAGIGVLRAQQSPGKIVISDEGGISPRFCRATVSFQNAEDWQRIKAAFFDEGGGEITGLFTVEMEPLKERIGAAIDAGEDVPGADRVFGEWGLRLK